MHFLPDLPYLGPAEKSPHLLHTKAVEPDPSILVQFQQCDKRNPGQTQARDLTVQDCGSPEDRRGWTGDLEGR